MNNTPSHRNKALFKSDFGEQPIKLIKAAQAGKLLSGTAHAHTNHVEAHKAPEIRLVQTGAGYCDLEVICRCGESTQVRCWNTTDGKENGVL